MSRSCEDGHHLWGADHAIILANMIPQTNAQIASRSSPSLLSSFSRSLALIFISELPNVILPLFRRSDLEQIDLAGGDD